MRLPVSVTPPIKIARATVDAVKVEMPSVPRCRVAQPTSKLDAPPEPLKSATISGMLVIATNRAAEAPMMLPRMMPPIMTSKPTMF